MEARILGCGARSTPWIGPRSPIHRRVQAGWSSFENCDRPHVEGTRLERDPRSAHRTEDRTCDSLCTGRSRQREGDGAACAHEPEGGGQSCSISSVGRPSRPHQDAVPLLISSAAYLVMIGAVAATPLLYVSTGLAVQARVQGVVILEAVVDPNGRVENVTVLRSIPLLDRAAIEAVRQWRYSPLLLNGQPDDSC